MLKLLDVIVDAVQFIRNVDALRTVRNTLVASDAVTGLTESWHTAVVAYQKCLTGFALILGLRIFRNVSFVHTFVIVEQYSRNVETIWTWHAVFAVVARNCRELHHQIGCGIEKSHVVGR